jgi:hypothetical protein
MREFPERVNSFTQGVTGVSTDKGRVDEGEVERERLEFKNPWN